MISGYPGTEHSINIMKPYVVLVGTASVGKTTVALDLVPMMKEIYGEPVHYIKEVVRTVQLTYGVKINKEATSTTQRLIEEEYKRQEDIYHTRVKLADRSIIDRFSYTILNGGRKVDEEKSKLLKWYDENVARVCKNYSSIFYIPLADDLPLTLDGVRSKDEDYRREIDEFQKGIIKSYAIDVHVVKGKHEERLKTIRKALEENRYGSFVRNANKIPK